MKQSKFKKILTAVLILSMVVGIVSPMVYVDATDTTTITVDQIVSAEWISDQNHWAINLQIEKPLKDVTAWIGYMSGMTYSYDGGEATAVRFETVSSTQLIANFAVPQASEGKTLTIDGTGMIKTWADTVLHEAVKFSEPVTLVGTASGWALQQNNPGEITVTGVTADTTWQETNNAWIIYVNITGMEGAGITAWTQLTGETYSINNQPANISTGVLSGGKVLEIYFPNMPQDMTGQVLTIEGTTTLPDNTQYTFSEPATLIGTYENGEYGWKFQEPKEGSTGALSLVDKESPKTTTIQFDTKRTALDNTVDKDLTPVVGKAAMFYNGVAFSGGSLKSVTTTEKNRLEWTIPTLDIQVGDELKLFGEFTYGSVETIWVIPTVIQCVNVDGSGTYWEVSSSQEETVKTAETADENVISVSDFGCGEKIEPPVIGNQTAKIYDGSIIGKTFKTYIQYSKTDKEQKGATIFYYGAPSRTWISCVAVRMTDTQAEFRIYDNNKTLLHNIKESISEGKEYLLEIKISEGSTEDEKIVNVSFDGKAIYTDQMVSGANFANQMYTYKDGETALDATYYDYGARNLELKMEEAKEITATDFQLDGTHTQATRQALKDTVDGKKLVLEVSDIVGGITDTLQLDYANVMLQLGADQKTVKVYTACGDKLLGTYNSEQAAPYRIEVFTEYIDFDGDKINDDMRMLLRVNQTMVNLETVSEAHCSRCGTTTVDGYWICTNDRLYSETSQLQFSSPTDEDGNVFSISDLGQGDVIKPTNTTPIKTTYNNGIVGKTFKMYVTYEEGGATNSSAIFYYGATQKGWNEGVVLSMAGTSGYFRLCHSGTLSDTLKPVSITVGQKNLVEIRISEGTVTGSYKVSVIFNGTTIYDEQEQEMNITNDLYFFRDIDSKVIAEYQDYKAIESYTISSLSTQVVADLTDGVLTISGKGTVLPTALNGVVADPTTVKEIVIESGIIKVESGVFNGFTALKKVTYADTVTSVADDAFSGCSEDVEITCPIGTEFYGGLQNALIVKAVADIYIPNTGIVNPAVVVTRVTSSAIYQNLKKSSVAILDIDENLNVLDGEGATICTVADYTEEYKNTIIPAFYLDNEAEATALCTYLSQNNIDDAYYMTSSENAGILKTARTTYSKVRGILEYSQFPADLQERGEHRRTINNNLAMIAVYPSAKLTADIVAEYNLRGISVWSYANSTGDVYAGISDGVNGLITSNPNNVIDVYEGITEKTLSGKPIAMAHRAVNGDNPCHEQTLKIMAESVNIGSTALEMDIVLTKDKELVVIGGDVFNRINTDPANKTHMSAYTLEEIKRLSRDKWDDGCEVASLREVFDAYKNTDIALYLHINYITANAGDYVENYTEEQLSALHGLVAEFENAGNSIADNVVVFYRGGNAADHRGDYGLSFIGGTYMGNGNTHWYWTEEKLVDQYTYIKYLSSDIGSKNTQQLPYQYYLVDDDGKLSYRMSARGYLTLQTANMTETKKLQDDYFINKIGGPSVMTNHPEYASEYRYQINVASEKLALNSTLTLDKKVNTVGDGQVNVNCGFISVSGDDILDANGKIIATGNAVVVYYADITLARDYEGGLSYRIYSNPVTITAVEQLDLEGDMNGDFALTVVDLVDLKRAVSVDATESKFDLTGDGKVDINDLAVIRKKILNFIISAL